MVRVGETTGIAWTDHTFNIAWGCTKVSPGCKHCYAEALVERFGAKAAWGTTGTRRTFGAKHWREPVKWNEAARAEGRRHRVFCSSMCDVFEDNQIVDSERVRLWALVRATPWIDWQILTKRADRIVGELPPDWGPHGWTNVWLGVSIENADYAWRADHLRRIPAAVRFISYEPALGPLAQAIDLRGIDWLIYGGESGPGYRAEDKQWARDIRTACNLHGVAFFHKQSAAPRTEMGIELDGEIVRAYPNPRLTPKKPLTMPNPKTVAIVVQAIWRDLCGRRGYDLEELDTETQDDIKASWERIVAKALRSRPREKSVEECVSTYWLAHNANESADDPHRAGISAVRAFLLDEEAGQ